MGITMPHSFSFFFFLSTSLSFCNTHTHTHYPNYPNFPLNGYVCVSVAACLSMSHLALCCFVFLHFLLSIFSHDSWTWFKPFWLCLCAISVFHFLHSFLPVCPFPLCAHLFLVYLCHPVDNCACCPFSLCSYLYVCFCCLSLVCLCICVSWDVVCRYCWGRFTLVSAVPRWWWRN